MKKYGVTLTLALLSLYFWPKRQQTLEVQGAVAQTLIHEKKGSPVQIIPTALVLPPTDEIDELALCLENSSMTCSPSLGDAKEGYYTTAQKIESILNKSKHKSEADRIRLASKALLIQNDDVRSAALELISDVKAQPLELIFETCAEARSPKLINDMFEVFEKTENAEDLTRIHHFVQLSILSGPLSSAPLYADKIGSLLNQDSVSQYQDVLAQLPKESARFLALQTSLTEFTKR